jgi:hypothetical protein
MKMHSGFIVLSLLIALGGCTTQDARTDSTVMGSTSKKEMGKPGPDETPLSRCRNPCSIQPGPGCC